MLLFGRESRGILVWKVWIIRDADRRGVSHFGGRDDYNLIFVWIQGQSFVFGKFFHHMKLILKR